MEKGLFKDVFFFRRLPIMLLIYVLAIIATVFLSIKFLPLAIMFFLCRYDMIGYYQIRGSGELDKLLTHEPPERATVAYRFQDAEISVAILAIAFFVVLYLLNFWNAMWAVLAFYIPYAFGFKDVLYYLGYNDIRGLSDWQTDENGVPLKDENGNKIKYKWSWMYWTPAGIFNWILSKKPEGFIQSFKNVFIYHTDKIYVWTRTIKYQAAFGLLVGILAVLFIW